MIVSTDPPPFRHFLEFPRLLVGQLSWNRQVDHVMVDVLLGTTHPEMKVTDCADADTRMIVDVLTPTHRTIEVTEEDITPPSMTTILSIDTVARTLLVTADTADTVTTTTHRDGEGAEDITMMTIHRNVDGAEDMVITKKIRRIGRVTDVVVNMKKI